MPQATIRYGSAQAEMSEGEQVRLGRGSTCDVSIGNGSNGPEDLGVSRAAATLSMQDGRIWVRNDSSSQPVYLVPETGPTRMVENQGEIASLPLVKVIVQFRGRIQTHNVTIELDESPDFGPTGPVTGEAPPTQHLLEFSSAERRILSALCEPLLTKSGDEARPASYAQAAERVFLSRSRVENCVGDLIKKFASAGIPGLEGSEAKDNLCRYAVRSGSISSLDLAAID